MSYQRPDSTIYQTIRRDTPTSGRRNALVFGPQYVLQLNDGRAMDSVNFTQNAAIPLRYKVDGVWTNFSSNSLRLSSAGVEFYASNLLAPVTDLDTPVVAFTKEGYNKLRLSANNLYIDPDYVGGAVLNAGLLGRAVRVGDYMDVTVDDVTRRRRVVALLPKPTASSYNTVVVNSGSWYTSGNYVGTVDRTYTLEVIAVISAGAYFRVRVLDSAAITPVTEVVVASEAAVSLIPSQPGLLFTLQDTFDLGNSFKLKVTGSSLSTQLFDGVLLDGAIPTGSLEVDIYQLFSGLLTSYQADGADVFAVADDLYTLSDLGLSSAETGVASIPFSNFINDNGTVFASWKASVIPAEDEQPIAVSLGTVTDDLGENNYENNLCSCAYDSLLGISDSPAPVVAAVYALRTDGDSAEAMAAALLKVRGTDIFYALVPATTNIEAMNAAVTHAVAMSAATKKLWRKVYASTESPGEYDAWGILERGTRIQGELAAGVVTITPEDEALASFSDDATVGDYIYVGGVPHKMQITAILSASEVEVSNHNGAGAIGGVTLIRANTARNAIKFLVARSASFLNNRRVVNVWCDSPLAPDGGVIPARNLAAYEAGARVGSKSQLGRTRGKVSIVAAAPTMYTKFDDEDLDEIAGAGTYIITQRTRGGEVFVRHQVTTNTTDGILYREDNITAIVDEYSFAHKDIIDNFIGKRNATKWSISDLKVALQAMTTDSTQVEKEFSTVGPLIVSFFDADGIEGQITVKQDNVLADHLSTFTKLRVAVSINGVISYIDVEVAFTN